MSDSIATKVVIRLMTDPKFAAAFYDTVKKYQEDPDGDTKVNNWLTTHGYSTTLSDIEAAFKELQKTSLLPWTSTYTTNQKSITITIEGQVPPPLLGKVWINDTPITEFTFANQTLTWSDGNSSSASLAFVDGGSHKLSFSGKYWTSGDNEPASNNISGQNTSTQASLSNWVGSYATSLDSKTGPEVQIFAVRSGGNYKITVEDTEISHYTFGESNVLSWSDSYNNTNAELTFSVENAGLSKVRRKFSGWYWAKGSSKPEAANFGGIIDISNFKPYVGMYRSYVIDTQGKTQYGLECFLAEESNAASFTIGTNAIKSPAYSNSTITWSTSSGNANNGIVTFFVDPKKHTPGFSGKTWTGSTAPTSANFFGSFDITYLQEWAGVYTTYSQFDSTWSPGAQIVVNAAKTPRDVQITYGGMAIKSPVFNNPILTWSKSSGNVFNASITFYYAKDSTVPVLCYGKIWVDAEPSSGNVRGRIDFQYLQSWTGIYATYLKDSSGKYTIDGPQVTIFGALTESASAIFVAGQTVTYFKYSTEGSSKYGYLQWSNIDNATGGDITFFLSDSLVRSFSGYYWKKGESKPSSINWVGNTNPRTPHSQGSQPGGFWRAKNVVNSIAMGLIIVGIIEVANSLWMALKSGDKKAIENDQQRLREQEEQADEQQAANEEQEVQQPVEPPEIAWRVAVDDEYPGIEHTS